MAANTSHDDTIMAKVSCNDHIIDNILGCASGVSGFANEHNPRCYYSIGGHSPHRNKISQQNATSRMLNEQLILDTGYKAIACEQLLKIDASISDQDFIPLWKQFVLETQALVNALPDYDRDTVHARWPSQ